MSLFGRSAIAVLEEVHREPIYPEPVKPVIPEPAQFEIKSKLTRDEITEYIAIADEVGLDSCTDLLSEKLKRCLEEEGISPYNKTQVVAYLDDKLGKEWEWCGLRQKDVDHLKGWISHATGQRDVRFSDKPYRLAVPMPVLLTVKTIQQKVSGVYFYVSAKPEPEGDPFLMVSARGIGAYIVEKWDEPGFRERKTM